MYFGCPLFTVQFCLSVGLSDCLRDGKPLDIFNISTQGKETPRKAESLVSQSLRFWLPRELAAFPRPQRGRSVVAPRLLAVQPQTGRRRTHIQEERRSRRQNRKARGKRRLSSEQKKKIMARWFRAKPLNRCPEVTKSLWKTYDKYRFTNDPRLKGSFGSGGVIFYAILRSFKIYD